MKRVKGVVAAAAMAAAIGMAMPANEASAAVGVKIGVLDCRVSAGVGMVVTSNKALSCVYDPAGGGAGERYEGEIRKFGIDIGATGEGRVIWAVFAPSSDVRAGALAGTYAGASGEATVGVGAGAHALIGGFNRSITLQPLSVQGQTGLNVAAAITRLTLRAR